MTRTCTVCCHPERETIDRQLVEGVPYRRIATQFGLSEPAVSRHQEAHLPAALVKAHEARQAASADSLLAEIQRLQARTYRLLDVAEAMGNVPAALAAIREARASMELMARLAGQLAAQPVVVNVLTTVEWAHLETTIAAALLPYPEASYALAAAIREDASGESD